MNLTGPGCARESPLDGPDDTRNCDAFSSLDIIELISFGSALLTKWPTKQHGRVLAAHAEDLLRPDGSPQDRRSEECVDTGAGVVVRCVGSAYPRNLVHLEVKNSDTDEG